MHHPSDDDGNPHYSLQGEDDNGEKVAGGHVHLDKSKQTVSSSAHLPYHSYLSSR